MKLETISNIQFDNFVTNNKYSTFMQTSMYYDFFIDRGNTSFLVGLIDNGTILGVSFLVERNFGGIKALYAIRGFILDYTNIELVKSFTKEVKLFAKSNGYAFIKIEPYIDYEINNNIQEEGLLSHNNLISNGYKHLGFTKGYIDIQPRHYCYLQLDKDYKTCFKNFKQNTRNKISQAKRIDSEVIEIDDYKLFQSILAESGSRKGFDIRDYKYYEILKKHLKDNIKFLVTRINTDNVIDIYNKQIIDINNRLSKASKETTIKELNDNINSLNKKISEIEVLKQKYGNIVYTSAAAFITYGSEIMYFHSGEYEDTLFLSGQYLLQDYIINYAIDNNYNRYNMLGYTGNTTNDGVYTFKKGFNCNTASLIGEYDLACSYKYNIYKLLKGLRNIMKKS